LPSCNYLALVEAQEATSVFDRLRASEDYNLIVTSRDRVAACPHPRRASYVISLAAGAIPHPPADSQKVMVTKVT